MLLGQHFFDFIRRRHLAHDFDFTIDGQTRRHHDAEFHNFVDIRDLFQFVLQAQGLGSGLGVFGQLLTLGLSCAEKLQLSHCSPHYCLQSHSMFPLIMSFQSPRTSCVQQSSAPAASRMTRARM